MTQATIIRSFEDRSALVRAYQRLENNSVIGKLSNLVGAPIGTTSKLVPAPLSKQIHNIIERAIEQALSAAVLTLASKSTLSANDRFNSTLASVSGASSGFIGLAGLLADLPFTTTVILRSIAGIARENGEDLESLNTRASCISVLALGTKPTLKTASTDYYNLRFELAEAVSNGPTEYMSNTLPTNAIARLIPAISVRFGAMLSHKIPAQSIPMVGAVSGATVNTLLINHFQRMAHGHFAIRQLEKKYGADVVMHDYEALL